ncbi:MAG TPA: hypothetical protein VHC22_14265 [Pirellulales bacterium]|nr:hypothetical protein [Pirellulales bacterium]
MSALTPFLTTVLLVFPGANSDPTDDNVPDRCQLAINAITAVQAERVPPPAVQMIAPAFEGLKKEDIELLIQHKHNAVAFRAAWERQKRQLFVASNKRPSGTDEQKVDRFVGVLEGRLRVGIPVMWHDRVQNAYANERKKAITFASGGRVDYHMTALGLATAQPLHCSILKSRDEASVSFGGRSFTLPIELVSRLKDTDATNVTIGSHGDICLLLGHSNPSATILICYDTKLRQELWQSRLWGIGPGLFGGIDAHVGEIVCHDEQATVFGVSTLGAYIESFRLKDGTAAWRFATNDWRNVGGYLGDLQRKD